MRILKTSLAFVPDDSGGSGDCGGPQGEDSFLVCWAEYGEFVGWLEERLQQLLPDHLVIQGPTFEDSSDAVVSVYSSRKEAEDLVAQQVQDDEGDQYDAIQEKLDQLQVGGLVLHFRRWSMDEHEDRMLKALGISSNFAAADKAFYKKKAKKFLVTVKKA